ncbi:hypothetical protein MUK42_37299 [Musa troglodytarum]|uniref:Uncharacterized protein n=1 Tax=Musa troglodytarum TaxID=320322 RepID=A0A9E7E9Z8_9LILI|nr:hypothetical protein MUK42_37299 [Musa troglodytarum]
MEEWRATINSLWEEHAKLERQLEECRSQIEILRKRNSTLEEGLEKAAADRPAPGTPSPPATDSRVGSLAAGQQMQSAGLQGGAKNGEEAQDGDRCRGEDDA